jgi:hypothetical protein
MEAVLGSGDNNNGGSRSVDLSFAKSASGSACGRNTDGGEGSYRRFLDFKTSSSSLMASIGSGFSARTTLLTRFRSLVTALAFSGGRPPWSAFVTGGGNLGNAGSSEEDDDEDDDNNTRSSGPTGPGEEDGMLGIGCGTPSGFPAHRHKNSIVIGEKK